MLLDIALPRDIDPRVRELPGIVLIDLDDLERMCPVDASTRNAEHQHAEALAVEEADRLDRVAALPRRQPGHCRASNYAETIRTAELRRSAARLRDLTPEQVAAVDALTAGIVNKLHARTDGRAARRAAPRCQLPNSARGAPTPRKDA